MGTSLAARFHHRAVLIFVLAIPFALSSGAAFVGCSFENPNCSVGEFDNEPF
jgi:hypothetical protein